MQSVRTAIVIVALILVCLARPGRAQDAFTLELDSTLAYCETAHRIGTCSTYHVDTADPVAIGSTIQLDGETYQVVWMGPGYYLDDGAVVEPIESTVAGLKGRRWLEVYPKEGKIHRSRAWRDRDRNKALSSDDILILDGRAREIRDVRLHLRVRPAAAAPE
ncbi:MAG: hypothetical protein ACJ75H_06880 [Thermoanaerobaculia bacterium]